MASSRSPTASSHSSIVGQLTLAVPLGPTTPMRVKVTLPPSAPTPPQLKHDVCVILGLVDVVSSIEFSLVIDENID